MWPLKMPSLLAEARLKSRWRPTKKHHNKLRLCPRGQQHLKSVQRLAIEA